MNKVIAYVKESYDELIHRVTWPTQKDLTRDTTWVLIGLFVFSLFIRVVDLGIDSLMSMIYVSL